uniref:Lysosomal-associated transmembrane protein 4B n=1 Tax=Romanomermis culicivorax TaxID=13658 RepID=A0A915KEM0_ROMCU
MIPNININSTTINTLTANEMCNRSKHVRYFGDWQKVAAAPALTPISAPIFDESQSKYKCCCGCMHSRTGGIIIGILELIAVVVNFAVYASNYAQSESSTGQFVVSLLATSIVAVIVVLLFFGIKKENHNYIIPHLVLQILGIVALAIVAIINIVAVCVSSTVVASSDKNSQTTTAVLLTVIAVSIVVLLSAIFQIWFFVVILRLYHFYRDKKSFAVRNDGVARLGPSTTVQYVTFPPQVTAIP